MNYTFFLIGFDFGENIHSSDFLHKSGIAKMTKV